ncbi:oligosaccharide flippase family protein [Arthrobacter sp. zg-Y1219]|uniref:oligosaccharide flippase family protein n=1 Tax=Arthrobacter sp. zg-Y1219 TaxID=3049067 RepID=UPI0024C3B8F4|nr:oligosaccharide flippase family protein [Arthrobacter sp. zg-Y1219]MDK1360187.1 oligosaccharide flippase family protein [Arthrobacter sp. zg-Y1219]
MTNTSLQEPSDISKNVSLTALGNLAYPAVAFATAPILAWVLGADGRGELAAATAPLMLLISVAAFGLPESISYHTASRLIPVRLSLPRALIVLWCTGTGAIGLTWMVAPLLAAQDNELAFLILIAACALPFSLSVSALRGVAAGMHEWRRVNVEKYVTASVRLLGISVPALMGSLTLPVAVVVMAYSPILGGLAYAGLKTKNKMSAGQSHTAPTAKLLKYSAHVWIGAMSGVLLMRMDQLVMLPLAGAVQLGMYAVAVNVAELLLIVNNAVRDVMFSADAADRNDDRIHRAARFNLIVTAAISIPIAATAPWWFPFIFGPSFRDAIPVVEVLILATVAGIPGSVAGSALSARGRPGLRSKSLIIASVINIVGILLLVPQLGAMGAAYATLIGNVVASNLNIFWLSKHFRVASIGFYKIQRSDFVFIGRALMRGIWKMKV